MTAGTATRKEAKEPSKWWDAFRNSWWGLTIAIGLTVALDAFLFLNQSMCCLSGSLIGLVTFGLPYYFNMKRPRDLLITGTAILLALCLLSPIYLDATIGPAPTEPQASKEAEFGVSIVDMHVSDSFPSHDEEVSFLVVVRSNVTYDFMEVRMRISSSGSLLDFMWPDEEGTAGNFSMKQVSVDWRNKTRTYEYDTKMDMGFYSYRAVVIFRNRTDDANRTILLPGAGQINSYQLYPYYLMTYTLIMFFNTSLFYILVGMSWWMRRAKENFQGPADGAKAAAKAEFVCSDCGGDVYATEETCPHCGAKLED